MAPENVSHSEVEIAGVCETAHFYGYGMAISPKQPGDPLQIGNCFHELADAFYTKLRERQLGANLTIEDCRNHAYLRWAVALAANRYKHENMVLAQLAFDRYFEHIDPDEWEILSTEDYLEYQVSDHVVLNGLTDLVVRIRKCDKPEHIGKIAVVDHKALNNFYTTEALDIHTQLPKYGFALNRLGRFPGKINLGILNQVRHRRDARDFVTRSYINLPDIRQQKAVDQHIRTAEKRIIPRRKMNVVEWKEDVTGAYRKDICKWCDFARLCHMEMMGKSDQEINDELRLYFVPKDMSYREERKRQLKAKQENG